jgi:hypothetical protein
MIDGLNRSQNTYENLKASTLRLRVDMSLDIKKIFKALDSTPETEGAGVVFIDGENTAVRLREFKSNCNVNPITVILREPPKNTTAVQYAEELKGSVRESKLVGEIINASLSCSAAIFGWVVVLGSLTVVPITGGASAAVTYIGGTVAIASSLQCINGSVRSYGENFNPEWLDGLDNQEWYQNITKALDWISLGGAAVSGAYTIKAVLTLSMTTGQSIPTILKGLNRQERLRLTREVNRLNIPNVSNKAFKQLVSAGKATRRYSQQQISNAIMLQMKDALGASLSVAGSGSIQSLAIGLYEDPKFEL